MGNFGQDLKKAREAKKVTLEAISAATKITTRYLQAVEAEQFDQLPGGVFRRNIVRSYARAAGLDEETWVKRYLEISHEETSSQVEDQAWIEFAENVGRSRGRSEFAGRSGSIRWAGVAALLLIVIGMGWFVWGYVHNKAAAAAVKAPGISSSSLTARSTAGVGSF